MVFLACKQCKALSIHLDYYHGTLLDETYEIPLDSEQQFAYLSLLMTISKSRQRQKADKSMCSSVSL